MSAHTSTAFNHSCLKVPINPESKLPAPLFEQKYVSELRNYSLKSNSNTKSATESGGQSMGDKKRKETLKALIEFYDSIPDYSDVNHLSNQEFYRRVENLKAKQKAFYEYLDAEYNVETKLENLMEDYVKEVRGQKSAPRKGKCKKNVKAWEKYNARELLESDSVVSSDKDIPVAPPSRRSVRIESPKSDIESRLSDPEINSKLSETTTTAKSHRNISPISSKDSHKTSLSALTAICDDYSAKHLERKAVSCVRSLPSSPVKPKSQPESWRDCGITIPKPFKMTLRDLEEQAYCELLQRNVPAAEEKPRMFRAHPVPVESKIPLFDEIMMEQEIRRQIVKQRSKDLLKAQMRPFSFTRRDEELQLSKQFSKSTPQLNCDEPELKSKPFRAKPIPKNLFSNYIYRKMHEDEFYRILKKKIRAEELLKASSLPPSMAAREKTHKKHGICPRSAREFEDYRSPEYLTRDERLELELQGLKDDFMTETTPRAYRVRTRGRASAASKSASAADTCSERAPSAPELLQSVNRSNLAAVLRVQSARKRMEGEISKKLEEQRARQEARWRERAMRRRPVWQELDRSHEEEIAVRLQARRDEERLRQEEHRQRMQLMLGRVQQMPTLFERQSLVAASKSPAPERAHH